jgi:leucyl/phenylalanyl-tRNA--protein transferase
LIDCQVYSEHLASLGATNIPRHEFIKKLQLLCDSMPEHQWQCEYDSSNIIEHGK